ncbi:MAG TPA: arginine deiminase-related protein [Gammaproteobacteria bacterium]
MSAATGCGSPARDGAVGRDAAAPEPRVGQFPEPQAARAALMIRPAHFGANPETAASNRFQAPADAARRATAEGATGEPAVAAAALAEFDALADALARAGIGVHVLPGRNEPVCPDEVFPNNWLSTHADGTLVRYPMLAPSRRRERRDDVADTLRRLGYAVERIVDLTALETQGLYLEGTGSLVLDRTARVAFACPSARTSPDAMRTFCTEMGYEPVLFDAVDRDGHPIYHTNVMMSVGTAFALVCTDAIRDPDARGRVLDALRANGKRVIEIGYRELHAFAANLLELRGRDGPVIALSRRAFASLSTAQRGALAEHGTLVPVPVDAIETYGGGSVRCVLAEVHLPLARGGEARELPAVES